MIIINWWRTFLMTVAKQVTKKCKKVERAFYIVIFDELAAFWGEGWKKCKRWRFKDHSNHTGKCCRNSNFRWSACKKFNTRILNHFWKVTHYIIMREMFGSHVWEVKKESFISNLCICNLCIFSPPLPFIKLFSKEFVLLSQNHCPLSTETSH